jgi:cytochrome P450
MKKITVVELLSATQVKRIESIRAHEVGRLLQSVAAAAARGAVNVSAEVKALAPDLVARAMFGGNCAEKADFICRYNEVSQLVSGFFLVDLFPSSRLVRWLSIGERRLLRSYGGIQRIIASIIESRKAASTSDDGDNCSLHDHPAEDLLGVLLRLQKEGSLAFPLTSEIIGAVMFVSTPTLVLFALILTYQFTLNSPSVPN